MNTPEQQRAIVTTGEHISVSAGAGSGKTRVLVDRIVHLLEHENVSISEIVAITFTRKAASEMKERLRKECYKKAPDDDAQAMTKWRDILYQLDTARITTIDSFCSGLLREHALWLEDDPDYALMSESDMALLPKRIAQETLIALLDRGDERALHVAMEMGIAQTVDVLVGWLKKSNVHDVLMNYAQLDAEGIAQLWHDHLDEYIREKVEVHAGQLRVLEGVIDDPKHKYEQCRSQLLQLFSGLVSGAPADVLKEQAVALSQLGFQGARIRKSFDAGLYEDLVAACKECRDFVKTFVVPHFDSAGTEASAVLSGELAGLYQQVYEAYQSHKRSNSLKDFSDLLRDALRLLETQPKIRKQVAGSIRYLMIDEFQDTNPAQWDLARCLMRTETQSGPELFIVGDAKQSIYRFRGADVTVFQEAQRHTTPPILLNKNFRTLPNVMDWINDFFLKSQRLKAVADPWERLEAHRPAAEGSRLIFLLNTVPAKSLAYIQRQSEAARIADQVLTMCTAGSGYSLQEEDSGTGDIAQTPVNFGDVALLFRAKSQLYLYENALKAKGIPYLILGGSDFFYRQEISDITNLLQVLLDPWHEEALYAWLRSPMVALSDNSLVTLGWQQGLAGQFYGDAALADDEQQERLHQARRWMQEFRGQVNTPVSELLQGILMATHFEAILLSLSHGEQRLRNVQKLLDTAREMTQSGKPHLHEFIQFLEEQSSPGVLEGDAPLLDEQRNAVTLMTIHASKGLEFPVVILPDTSTPKKAGRGGDGIQSHTDLGVCVKPVSADDEQCDPAMYNFLKKVSEDEEVDEDARVLYVAMTRARDYLVISGTLLSKENKKGELTVSVAGKKSWLAEFDAVFGIVEADTLSDAGTGFAVFHEAHGTAPLKTDEVNISSHGTIESTEFEPLRIPEIESTYVSTTAWLDRQFPGPERAEQGLFNPQQYLTMQRGTLVHRYLELWDFHREHPPDIHEFLATEYPLYADDESMIESLDVVVQQLLGSEVHTLLNEGGALRRELPFVVPYNGQWISGTIDVLTDQGVIIDYKTGTYREESLPRYEAQLRLYAQALKQLTGEQPTAAWIYFVDSGHAHEVGLG